MSILRLQTASPNLKNNGFSMEILTFLKNQGFVLEDWFGSFLALFLAHFGVLDGVSGALRSIKLGLQFRAFFLFFCPKIGRAICPKIDVELNCARWTWERR